MDERTLEAIAKTHFSLIDACIIVAYLAISVVVGFKVKKYASSMASYIGAGRALGTYLGVATMAGTELGLITVMYSSQKGFTGGFASFHIALVAGLVTLAVGLTGFIVYRLRQHRVLTIPEFYEVRFGRRVRILGGVILALAGILNMGLFLKVGSQFIVGITGMAPDGVALPLVMAALLTLVLLYTVFGGMISVVVTDYIQFVVLSAGLLLTTALAIKELGWNEVFLAIHELKGETGFDPFRQEAGFGYDYVVWMVFLGLVSCAIWPTAVARALAMESPTAVKRQYVWSSLSFLIRFLIPYFWGICAFVYIMTRAPDLKEVFFPESADATALDNLYAMPVFFGRLLPTGIIGILSAAMIAAFMSTHDSYLLCWGSVITQDIIAPLRGEKMTARSRVRCTRIAIVVIGIWVYAWGTFYQGSSDIWDYMAITGAVYFSGAFALLVFGLYWKRASSTGAMFGLLTGLLAILGLDPIHKATRLDQWLSGAEVGLCTVGLTCAALVAGSLLYPDQPTSEEEETS